MDSKKRKGPSNCKGLNCCMPILVKRRVWSGLNCVPVQLSLAGMVLLGVLVDDGSHLIVDFEIRTLELGEIDRVAKLQEVFLIAEVAHNYS